MVILKGHILVPYDELQRVKSELAIHIELTKQEIGCLVFEVSQDKNIPNKFDVYEEFVDQKAFDFHQSRVKSSNWGRVTANVQRHYKITSCA